jgi:hypothetical protein
MAALPPTLGDVVKMLDANAARNFMEVAAIYKYGETDLFVDYVDFVMHEPHEWLRNFPKKWTVDIEYNRVRGGFRKILKTQSIIDILGKDKCTNASRMLLDVFKIEDKEKEHSVCVEKSDTNDELKQVLRTVVKAYKTLLETSDNGKSTAILLDALTKPYL